MFTISKGFLGLNSREQIIRLQGQVDKQYAGLKDMAEERRRKLENMYQLFQLKREADDLEQWITEKEMVASSQEMGQDFDHVTVSTTAPAFLAVDTASHAWFQALTIPLPLQGVAQGCSHARARCGQRAQAALGKDLRVSARWS